MRSVLELVFEKLRRGSGFTHLYDLHYETHMAFDAYLNAPDDFAYFSVATVYPARFTQYKEPVIDTVPLIEVIRSVVESAGAEGLCNPSLECGCSVKKGEFILCDYLPLGCVLARKKLCSACDAACTMRDTVGYCFTPLIPVEVTE